MRSARLTLGIAAVVVALTGITTAAIRRADTPEPIKPAAITYEQTPTAITVHIHNPNRQWGLRNQRVRIALHQFQDSPFIMYGPDRLTGVSGHPEWGEIHCCLVTELRPGGDYSFRLLPSTRFKVNAVRISVVGPPGWIEM